MHNQLRNFNFYMLLLADIVMFVAALLLAYSVRFSLEIPLSEYQRVLVILPWLIVVKACTFFLLGAYRGMWRYTSLPDIQRLFEASLVASLVLITGLTFVTRFQGYPRSVFIADCIFTFFLCGGIRTVIRLWHSPCAQIAGFRVRDEAPSLRRSRLLIIGAGDAADKIIREVQGNPRSPYDVVCCLDDDNTKHHRSSQLHVIDRHVQSRKGFPQLCLPTRFIFGFMPPQARTCQKKEGRYV